MAVTGSIVISADFKITKDITSGITSAVEVALPFVFGKSITSGTTANAADPNKRFHTLRLIIVPPYHSTPTIPFSSDAGSRTQ